ncbi:MAG: DUF6198 family protein [Methanobacteriaceae archaeon]|nr:DUF6198 family protein [Methanobacteriaceae archaeon]
MKIREITVRYGILFIGLFFMTLGVSLSIKANLGTSPISCIPYILSLNFPLSVGEFTILFNIFLVLIQILILRKDFKKEQLLQIVTLIPFGYFTDLNLYLLSGVTVNGYVLEWITCLIGAFTLAFGILIEVKAGVMYMPGEGIVLSIAKVLHKEFSKIKPFIDSNMVICGAILSFIFFGKLVGVREGTIVAAILIGFIIKFYKELFGDKLDYIRDKLING